MSASLRPQTFAPAAGATPEERIAHALEFIAGRMGMIEYDTTMIRMEIMKLSHVLGAMASRPSRPGVP
jgi:hypothetical protein